MTWTASNILDVLDRCSEALTFPMLDNGYFYLAASRLSLHRSPLDWALVVETFGFSPRTGVPVVNVETFASRLHQRDSPECFTSKRAYESYIALNPHNEMRAFYPFDDEDWQDSGDAELVATDACNIRIRGHQVRHPDAQQYLASGVVPLEPRRVHVFEACRVLADVHRDLLLATADERRVSVPPEAQQILQLEAWHHPDVAGGERPSSTATFRALASVLQTGDVHEYRSLEPPNTHWRNWPDGGTL